MNTLTIPPLVRPLHELALSGRANQVCLLSDVLLHDTGYFRNLKVLRVLYTGVRFPQVSLEVVQASPFLLTFGTIAVQAFPQLLRLVKVLVFSFMVTIPVIYGSEALTVFGMRTAVHLT